MTAAPGASWRPFAVGVGANLGDRRGQIGRARELVSETPGVREVRMGPIIESVPVLPDGVDSSHPDYLNTVFAGETTRTPRELLSRLLAIEAGFGRRRGSGCEPRTLDLDLLLVGDLKVVEPGLELPHPRMWSRDFVVEPLLALMPELRREASSHAGSSISRSEA
ncbi:MAG: 2-amino-4-hydroxy-6-hydroxymethyldihydropteridine diphosphokinase [Phycisphaera sp. TMED9]|nr:MAG: 2-amino-4-hydroxy-6-hydroxymethyldihydropteridine diphosphokinase [Phycisphaera sp. TMED9]RPG21959.1 MAG: 2-amino-4-hydroxy-6-hydroxymethyldihydropteridine diphosphokinase [Phycisphaera sp. TMED9]